MGWFGMRRSEAEGRRTLARTYYDSEVECRAYGWGDPAFVYDEEHELFRFTMVGSPSPANTPTGIC